MILSKQRCWVWSRRIHRFSLYWKTRVMKIFPVYIVYISPSKLLNITESKRFFPAPKPMHCTFTFPPQVHLVKRRDPWHIPVLFLRKPFVLWRQIQVGWCGISAGNQQWSLELEMGAQMRTARTVVVKKEQVYVWRLQKLRCLRVVQEIASNWHLFWQMIQCASWCCDDGIIQDM